MRARRAVKGDSVTRTEETALIVAWQRLEKTLTEANKHYLMYGDGGRAAAFRQLGGINQFIKSVAPDRPLLQTPLLALYLALHYLDHGVVEPMLAPNRSGRGRRPEHVLIKIRSAIAMSRLCEIGYSRSEAAKRVARELTALGHKATARAVADWRDELKSLSPSDPRVEAHRTILETEAKLTGWSPGIGRVDDTTKRSKLGRHILEVLRKFVLISRLTANPDLSNAKRKLKGAVVRSDH
jgi:hypothetical protein